MILQTIRCQFDLTTVRSESMSSQKQSIPLAKINCVERKKKQATLYMKDVTQLFEAQNIKWLCLVRRFK